MLYHATQILAQLLKLPFDQMKKLKPPFLSWEFRRLLGSDGSAYFRMFVEVMDELKIPLDSPTSLLMTHILVKTELVPEKARERLVARDAVSEQLVANFVKIVNSSYGKRSDDNQTNAVFVTIVQNVLVNYSVALVADRLRTAKLLHDKPDDERRPQWLAKLRPQNNPIHFAIHRVIEKAVDDDLAGRNGEEGQIEEPGSDDVNPLLASILTYHLKTYKIKKFETLEDYFAPFRKHAQYFRRADKDPFGLINA